jgi:hypothetical protein
LSFLAFAALSLGCLGLGWAFASRQRTDSPESRGVLALVTGWVVLSGTATFLSMCGVPWTWWSLAVPALAWLALARWLPRSSGAAATPPAPQPPAEQQPWRLGWGDTIAILALGALVFLAARGELLFPDFVYHWGTKTQKFALARGVDWQYLALPWLAELHHPEYPHLLPNLGALMTLLGGFEARAIGLLSMLALCATVLQLRGALREAGASHFTVQATTAWAGAALALFGINHVLAGSADPFLALALAVALPALLRPRTTLGADADVRVGLAAALAASAKIEGVALAGLLCLVHGVRRTTVDWRSSLRAAVRTVLPTVLVVTPWLYGLWRYGLRSSAAGRLDLGRVPEVLGGIWAQLFLSGWFGMATLLLLLPLSLARSDLRAVGWVVAGQLGFYVYTYLSAPFAPGYYIVSTFPRLTLHLLPVVVTAVALALDRWQQAPRETAE